MKIISRDIDSGKPFDWGKTSLDYAKFRDIYPKEFYQKIIDRKLCLDGQSILDIGTGTGVLPRNMYQYGAKWTAADISENQISMWEQEHRTLLKNIAPHEFDILHYGAIAELKKR